MNKQIHGHDRKDKFNPGSRETIYYTTLKYQVKRNILIFLKHRQDNTNTNKQMKNFLSKIYPVYLSNTRGKKENKNGQVVLPQIQQLWYINHHDYKVRCVL